MRVTKLIKEIKHLSYIDRLRYLNLTILLYRSLRGDMIMVYQLLLGIYDCDIACQLVKPTHFVSRNRHLRIFKQHVQNDLRKILFWKLYFI